MNTFAPSSPISWMQTSSIGVKMSSRLLVTVFVGLVALVSAATLSEETTETKPSTTTERPRVSCFVCSWAEDTHQCGDANFSLEHHQPSYYMDGCNVCYKKTQLDGEDNKLLVLRGCSIENWIYLPGCQYTYYEKGFRLETCACTSDYCNGGSFQYPQSALSSTARKPVLLWLVLALSMVSMCFRD